MQNSFATPANVICPQCGTAFRASVWLIIDAAECPDLLQRMCTSELHRLSCPNCGNAGTVNAPLLPR